MSVRIYQIRRRRVPKDSNFHSRRRDSLKSHNVSLFLIITEVVNGSYFVSHVSNVVSNAANLPVKIAYAFIVTEVEPHNLPHSSNTK